MVIFVIFAQVRNIQQEAKPEDVKKIFEDAGIAVHSVDFDNVERNRHVALLRLAPLPLPSNLNKEELGSNPLDDALKAYIERKEKEAQAAAEARNAENEAAAEALANKAYTENGVDAAEGMDTAGDTAVGESETVKGVAGEVTSDPAVAEPVAEDAAVAEPVEEDTAVAEPVEEDTAVTEPVVENAAMAEPVEEDAAVAEPVAEATTASFDEAAKARPPIGDEDDGQPKEAMQAVDVDEPIGAKTDGGEQSSGDAKPTEGELKAVNTQEKPAADSGDGKSATPAPSRPVTSSHPPVQLHVDDGRADGDVLKIARYTAMRLNALLCPLTLGGERLMIDAPTLQCTLYLGNVTQDNDEQLKNDMAALGRVIRSFIMRGADGVSKVGIFNGLIHREFQLIV